MLLNHITRSRLYGLVLLVPFVFCSCHREPAISQKATQPGPVSKAGVRDVVNLIESGKNRVIVVNFWATWCPPCVAEMPELSEFYRAADEDDLLFLSLSLDAPDQVDTVLTAFIREKNIPFPVYLLTDRDVDALSAAVGTPISGALPVTLVYSREGVVQKTWEGPITRKELDEAVAPYL